MTFETGDGDPTAVSAHQMMRQIKSQAIPLFVGFGGKEGLKDEGESGF